MMRWAQLVMPCLLLLHSSAGTDNHPQYAVFIPAEIHFPHTERACIHLSGLKDTFQLTVSLHLKADNLTLLKEEVHPPKLFKCISFQVPPPAGGSEEVGQLAISIQNEDQKHEKEQKVLLKSARSGTFVQTDKAVYKPSQKVHFRIVTLNEDFIADNHAYPLVELQDPNSNRIAQWLNVAPDHGIVSLSFPLAPEPAQGLYTIKVGDGIHHQFIVQEYVLPRFEVTVELPKVLTILEDSVQMRVCARYTYGKPVSGTFIASLCRKPMRYHWRLTDNEAPALCKLSTGQLEKSGCYSEKIETSFFNMTESSYMMSLEAEASLTEVDTGVTLSGKSSMQISSTIATVAFENTDDYYKSGIPYTGTMTLTRADGSPKGDESIYLFIESGIQRFNHTYVTDDSGKASFSLNTTDWASSVNIRGSFVLEQPPWEYGKIVPRYQDAYLWIKPFYSKSKSFLKIHSVQGTLPCGQTQEMQVEYIIQRAELQEDAHEMELHYLLVSNGAIVLEGTKELSVGKEQVLQGVLSIHIPISVQLAPSAKMLVYTIFKDGEVTAATTKFETSKCFKNQVSLGFSQQEALPGSDVTLKLQSSPNSLCAIRAVDKSTVLMKPEEELTVEKVYNLFRPGYYGGYPYQVEEYEPNPCPDFPGIPGVGSESPRVVSRRSNSRSKRYVMPPWWSHMEPDVYSLVKNMGIKMITNANIRQPVKCHHHPMYMQRHFGMAGPGGAPGPDVTSRLSTIQDSAPQPNTIPGAVNKVEQQIRTYFPETWLWNLTPVGESGMTDVAVTVPDTITEWVAGSFCLANLGFGMSHPVSLRAFKPFFVEPSLPYSVVRGETFTLKATVFNYLKKSSMVQVTLAKSEEFKMMTHEDVNYRTCLSAEEAKTFFWSVTATKLGEVNLTITTEALDTKEVCGNEIAVAPSQGRIDILIKPILVKPGGVLEEKAHSSLICPEEGKEASEEISLIVPENILKDSQRAHASILGDIMGTALQNIDKLLAMPYGCGEQNMVKFAPNIYILQYLGQTGQMTEQIKEKSAEFLKSGYQRQLTFKHADGSYSAFGDRDEEGNTWLTAFVMKSFGQARPFIFIDEKHINDCVAWLTKQQRENGCFRSVGKLFNNAMKGGIDDDLSLTVYITAAMLELGMPSTDSTVSQAMSCLKESLSNVTNIYTQALLAYTFTIAGDKDKDMRDKVIAQLNKQAVKSDGQLHWERKDRPKLEDVPYWFQAPSDEVELTSYALLAFLSQKAPSKEDIGTASQIVSWLSKQQNPYGGFSSTQDTVVGLQALAKYAAATYSEKGEVKVTVTSEHGFHQEFHVDNKNRLLLQQAPLTEIPGKYTVSASGKGCVYVQTTLRYNVPPPKSDATFKLAVSTEPESCTEGARTMFGITVTASYTGPREVSNMALIEVKMLSGYIPVKRSVKELESKDLVKKVEIKPDQVTIYIDQLDNIANQYTFFVEQDIEVKNMKPATVIVYDYYQKDEHALAEYNSPCSSEHQSKNENS